MSTTPIPTFPLKGKESSYASKKEKNNSLPLRGRDRVGVGLAWMIFIRVYLRSSAVAYTC
jgi:hypothetical protein